ncbi:uncharacterized protein KZ484_018641 isoform 2-T3 [Pholidichthys leucotaenia]
MTSVSTIKSHSLDVPQQNDSNLEEVVDEQLVNQERSFIVVQVGADCSQMKEEQEDVCISQEGEQFGLKQETQTFDEGLEEVEDNLHADKEPQEAVRRDCMHASSSQPMSWAPPGNAGGQQAVLMLEGQ